MEVTANESLLEREVCSRDISVKSQILENIKEKSLSLLNWYFEPKSFEKSGKLYEALGVNLFKKYCPTGGSWFSKKTGSSMILKGGNKEENLNKYSKLTEKLEAAHAFFLLPIYTTLMINNFSNGDYKGGVCWAISNLLLNMYPIITQRYNRNRVNKMLKKLEERRMVNGE